MAEPSQVEVVAKLQGPQSYICRFESGEWRLDVVKLMEFERLYRKGSEFFVR